MKEIKFRDILKQIPKLPRLELYTLESKIKKEWEKREKEDES